MVIVRSTTLVAITLLAAAASWAGPAAGRGDVSAAIRRAFDVALPTLNPDLQRHYAERMYRVTGEERYIPFVITGVEESLELLRQDVAGLNDPEYVASRSAALFDRLGDGRKGRSRRDLFENRPSLLISLTMLETVWRLQTYGLNDSDISSPYSRALEYLRTQPLSAFLLEDEVIRDYGAQAINAVVYLHDLGLGDIEDQFRRRFLSRYPHSNDGFLTDTEFENKIYTLTHFILAASGFCQHDLEANEFGWIPEYFTTRLDRILGDTKADIVAEVGLCYALVGQHNHPAVLRCTEFLVDSFDSAAGLIPSPSGSPDRAGGEHRNILAFILLSWPDQLRPGPRLNLTQDPGPRGQPAHQ